MIKREVIHEGQTLWIVPEIPRPDGKTFNCTMCAFIVENQGEYGCGREEPIDQVFGSDCGSVVLDGKRTACIVIRPEQEQEYIAARAAARIGI